MAGSGLESGTANLNVPSISARHGMQSFSAASLSQFIAGHPGTKTFKDCSDVYTFGNPHLNINQLAAQENSLVADHIDAHIALSTRSTRHGVLDSACEQSSQLSSLSGTSTESQSVIKTLNQNNTVMGFEPPSSHFQTWAENSPRAETSTDMEGDAKDERFENGNRGEIMVSLGCSDHERGRNTDSKVLRRLAQNREAARKSRLRKKAYVQQLESSRMKLNQLEQELDRARQQGVYVGEYSSGDQGHAGRSVNAGAAAFDMDYGRWVEEQNRQLSELRSALAAHVIDNDLRLLVDNGMTHYDELFRLKGVAVKADVFHIVSGMWKTHAERCFMWMGGFRPSELLKILIPQLEPLTEQQLLAVCKLQQSSQQAEDALSQGMEALQQNLADTLAAGSLGTPNIANYMGQMAMAMGKLGTLENFVRQADNLRQQTLQQMHRILTTRQAARGLLAMGDYFSRLRALSSLWIARPRE